MTTFTLDRNQAILLCRNGVEDFALRGNPTDEEVDAKLAEFETLSPKEQRNWIYSVGPPSTVDLLGHIDALHNLVQDLQEQITSLKGT